MARGVEQVQNHAVQLEGGHLQGGIALQVLLLPSVPVDPGTEQMLKQRGLAGSAGSDQDHVAYTRRVGDLDARL